MNSRTALLKQLVDAGSYPIDERAIAEAILVRSVARSVVPGVTFRCPLRHESQVRSFRPHRGAASFKLVRGQRRSIELRVSAAA